MTNMQKIELGNHVLVKDMGLEGVVVEINRTAKTAKVKIEDEFEKKYIQFPLSQLVVVSQVVQKHVNFTTTPKQEKLKIQIKYFDKEIDKIGKIEKGDWIDLRAAETVELKKWQSALIPLGVGMKLPEGYEANIVPRSSTFKNWGIIQTNSKGIVDLSYSGDEDEWKMPVLAVRATTINKNDRICQFRIVEQMPELDFEEVEHLDEESRGGFGSTGTN